ncbi:MAG: SDR family NAD(P)-dependent oxidoreductase [Clostridia bacterium]|nr:SDR family NAD(P)-dependent oxidoreductase [Clostridia bacterium]
MEQVSIDIPAYIEGMKSEFNSHMTQLNDLLCRLLRGQLCSMGMFRQGKVLVNKPGSRIGLDNLYDKWLEASISFLTEKKYVTCDGESYTLLNSKSVDIDAVWQEWKQKKEAWLKNSDMSARVTLLESTLRALPDILTGKVPATDIIFPDSSMALVEGVYKNNKVADCFNEVLADAVVYYIKEQLKQNPAGRIRILEVGAGTGGTSAMVLRKIKPFRDQIQEYCYTDISRAFLLHAEREYGEQNPFLSCKLFNVEAPVAGQGIKAGEYDIVIAANVLHATKNIRQTIRNAKATLRKQGLLLINELSDNSLFAHLTFGLLEGWWLYDDPVLRIPGSPLLSQATWQRVLEGEGFQSVFHPAWKIHDLGQQIIVAESDGVVRQKQQIKPGITPLKQAAKDQIFKEQSMKPRLHIEQGSGVKDNLLRDKSKAYLVKMVAEVLKIPRQKIDSSEPLESYGIDSILVVQITSALRKSFDNISSTLLFECQTIDALSEHFVKTQRDSLIKLLGLEEQQPLEKENQMQSVVPSVTPAVTGKKPRFLKYSPSSETVKLSPEPFKEPIAVIGMSGRYPLANNLKEFWGNLGAGRNCITEIPEDRWPLEDFYHPDPKEAVAQGKSYSKWGGFIEGFAEFDPLFFNISPRETLNMDPQERLFLEECWKVLEDAGYTRVQLSKQYHNRIGVFAGITKADVSLYSSELWKQGEKIHPRSSFSSVANRVSYLFNFRGPSMPIDTMCSSSLTAIHEACENIHRGECDLAIAGGVNLYLHPLSYVELCAHQMLSEDGQCKSFGRGGNGFVPGEGVGTILLKPLSKAVADHDNIYAVIRGTKINHGGKTNGYTVPSPTAQAELIKEAIGKADIHSRAITYIEAHGTGTELGDPIEIKGLTQAFEKDTADTGFCSIGSVKSNIGHLESAAGIAGVTKIILQMKNGQLAPSINSKELNPNIDFSKTPFVVQQDLAPWNRPFIEINGEAGEYPRIAGISSFGAGGSNAHIVIEEYIPQHMEESGITVSAQNPAIIVLSAKTEGQLQVQVQQLLTVMEEQNFTDSSLANLAYTLQVGREHMEVRLAVIAISIKELKEKLNGFMEGRSDIEDLYHGQVKPNREVLAVFAADEDLQQVVNKWLENRKYLKLLDLWVKGLNFDWNNLYKDARPYRISLPTYPFAKDKYWIPVVKTSIGTSAASHININDIHPLVHQNTSNFSEQRFSSVFTGEEFFLSDHVVKGQRVLPGVTYLEMARAAIELAVEDFTDSEMGIRLKDVVWARPVIVGKQPLKVSIGLYPGSNGEFSYEIYSKPEIPDAEKIVNSRGIAVIEKASKGPAVDIHKLRDECNISILSSGQCYKVFETRGIEYGPSHRGIERLYLGMEQVVAELVLPSRVLETRERFVLHPGIMDAALQTCLGLMAGAAEFTDNLENSKLRLPFALRELEIFGTTAYAKWAIARFSDGSASTDKVQTFDIDIADENGVILVSFKSLSFRTLEVEKGIEEADGRKGMLVLKPCWQEAAMGNVFSDTYEERVKEYTRHIVFLGEMKQGLEKSIAGQMAGLQCHVLHSNEQDLDQRYKNYTTQVFGEIQSILGGKSPGKTLIQIVVPVQNEGQLLTGLSGLLKTASLEDPKIMGQLIEVDSVEDAPGIVTKLKESGLRLMEKRIRYQGGKRMIPVWSEIETSSAAIEMPWRDKGVYLITGGAGGLGQLMAKEIAGKARNAKIIITGRSPLKEGVQNKLEELLRYGDRIQYKQADISSKEEVEILVGSIIRDFGGLNGIIHCAGVIRDNFIIKKTMDEISEVMAPKVSGLWNLDQATRDMSLDHFILFSSGAADMGNIGQADYSAANAFMNAYAGYRNSLMSLKRRSGKTLSILWPLWKEGGMRVDDLTEKNMAKNLGITPLSTTNGIQALYKGLSSGNDCIMVAEGNLSQMRQKLLSSLSSQSMKPEPKLVTRPKTSAELPDEASLKDNIAGYLREMVADTLKISPGSLNNNESFDKYGLDSIIVVEINNKLEKDFGNLSKTLFFEYSTIDELADYFVKTHKEVLLRLFTAEETTVPGDSSGLIPSSSGKLPQAVPKPKRVEYLAKQANDYNCVKANYSGQSGSNTLQVPQESSITDFLIRQIENDNLTLDDIIALPCCDIITTKDKSIKKDDCRKTGEPEPCGDSSDYVLIHEKELQNKPVLTSLVEEIDRDNPPVGYERLLYQHFFISAKQKKYLRLMVDEPDQLIVPFMPIDPVSYKELRVFCKKNNKKLLVVDSYHDWISSEQTRLIPLGVWQDIDINQFTLAGNKMRKLRYLVEKFRNSGDVKIIEFTPGLKLSLNEMRGLMMKWCEGKKNIIKHTFVCMQELLKRTLPSGYRAFLTYHNDKLCTVIVIEHGTNGMYVMDQEFYDPKNAPLGHMEYSITEIIGFLKKEKANIFSLGLTWYPFAFEDYPQKDPEGWAWLKEQYSKQTLLSRIFHQGETNYQFKKKFGISGEPVLAYLPKEEPFSLLFKYWPIFYQNSLTADQLSEQISRIPLSDLESGYTGRESSQTKYDLTDRQGRQLLISSTTKLDQIDYHDNPLDLATDSWYMVRSDAVKERTVHLKAKSPVGGSEIIKTIFPFKHIILTDRGRSAEELFYKVFQKTGKKILSAIPWASTLMHQLNNGFEVIELPHPSVQEPDSAYLFKGELDIEALMEQLRKDSRNIAMVGLEVLSNASGGNPVSLSHIGELKQILNQFKIPMVLDASRIVRNAFLIKQYEENCRQSNIWDIVRQTSKQADYIVTSLTKDFAVPVGGLIATNDDRLAEDIKRAQASQSLLITPEEERMIINALSDQEKITGLIEEQLTFARSLQDMLIQAKAPILQPACGHAIVINVSQLVYGESNTQKKETFLKELFIETGIRGGIHQVGKQKNTLLDQCIRLALPLGLASENRRIIFDKLKHFFAARQVPESDKEVAVCHV